MPSFPPRRRLPALLLVVLAVALVAGSGWMVYDDFRPTYQLSATAVDAPADAEVLDVEDLSPEAKAAFENARNGGYVVHNDPEFRETFPVYEAVYVRADGTVYKLWLSTDGINGLSLFIAVPLVAFALGLGGLGAWSYRREAVRPPLTALAAVGAATGANLAWPFTGTLFLAGIPVGPAKITLLAAAVAASGTWVGFDRYDLA
ncbi:hypothetical protein [Halorussus halophilus]|uniref:hypothetical protein n=1 Tax=Halorussus halophilus TaxID=2650975 RepID=UPI0013010224|nr:hypothetical protein [Halorussus halophilus]